MRTEGGFAALMDEARPEPATSANRTQPRDRVSPAEKTQAASDARVSNEPASTSNEPVTESNETAPASTEATPIVAEAPPLPGEFDPALAIGNALDETLTVATDVTPEAAIPAVPVAATVAAPTTPTTPVTPAAPAAEQSAMPAVATAAPAQATPDAPLPDMTEKPSQAASTAPAAPAMPPATDSASAKPVVATTAPEQSGLVAAPIKAAAKLSANESGEDVADPADTAPVQSGMSDTDAEATTPADAPQQPKQTRTPAEASNNSAPARPDAAPDKAAPQPDAAAVKPDDTALATKPNIDPSVQIAQLAVPAHAASTQAATPQALPVSAAQPIPVNAIAVEIAAQARAGNSRFEIRLDPPELGRIDVRLDVDHEGNVKSRLVIERADTYDLLRRDQSTLERALQQAGLKTSDNALEFSLRDQGFAQQRDADDQPRGTRAMIHEAEVAPSEAANGYARLLSARGGIDIRV